MAVMYVLSSVSVTGAAAAAGPFPSLTWPVKTRLLTFWITLLCFKSYSMAYQELSGITSMDALMPDTISLNL